MALRDNVYHEFGPILLEALFDQMLDEVNELRTNAGLPPRPKAAFLGAAHNNAAHLEPYNWMADTGVPPS